MNYTVGRQETLARPSVYFVSLGPIAQICLGKKRKKQKTKHLMQKRRTMGRAPNSSKTGCYSPEWLFVSMELTRLQDQLLCWLSSTNSLCTLTITTQDSFCDPHGDYCRWDSLVNIKLRTDPSPTNYRTAIGAAAVATAAQVFLKKLITGCVPNSSKLVQNTVWRLLEKLSNTKRNLTPTDAD